MGGPGSGRRRVKAPEKGFALPSIGTTLPEIIQFAEAVSRGLQTGDIDPRLGQELLRCGDLARKAAADNAEAENITKLDDMIRRAESLNAEAVAREVADRQHLKH